MVLTLMKIFDYLLDCFLATLSFCYYSLCRKEKETPQQTQNKIILPIIRRVVPQLIASEIIGVQPMTGPVGQIHTLRARYGNSENKKIFKIRIKDLWYNIKYFIIATKKYIWYYIQRLFYPHKFENLEISVITNLDTIGWLNEQVGQYRWNVMFHNGYGTIYFRHKSDLIAFKLRWS